MTAVEFLAKPESWCQGSFAKDKDGKIVAWQSKSACQFCATAAIMKVYQNASRAIYGYIRDKIHKLLGGESLVTWNDQPNRTHADVLALFKEAGV